MMDDITQVLVTVPILILEYSRCKIAWRSYGPGAPNLSIQNPRSGPSLPAASSLRSPPGLGRELVVSGADGDAVTEKEQEMCLKAGLGTTTLEQPPTGNIMSTGPSPGREQLNKYMLK